jgi:hypothetical protein
MRLAVMQPYIFPYLGYYQLVKAVDTFIFFDDVNYINKGWINRNNILGQNEPYKFTISLSKASQNKLINEIEISDYPKWRDDFLKLMAFNYKKAPQFESFYNWLQSFLRAKDYRYISELAADSVKEIATFLKLTTQFGFSSQLDYKTGQEMDGQEKVLSICRIHEAGTYINPKTAEDIGLYDKERFIKENRQLYFIKMEEVSYPQFKKDKFVPYLSILDVCMFNDTDQVNTLLDKYSL